MGVLCSWTSRHYYSTSAGLLWLENGTEGQDAGPADAQSLVESMYHPKTMGLCTCPVMP